MGRNLDPHQILHISPISRFQAILVITWVFWLVSQLKTLPGLVIFSGGFCLDWVFARLSWQNWTAQVDIDDIFTLSSSTKLSSQRLVSLVVLILSKWSISCNYRTGNVHEFCSLALVFLNSFLLSFALKRLIFMNCEVGLNYVWSSHRTFRSCSSSWQMRIFKMFLRKYTWLNYFKVGLFFRFYRF